MKFKLFLKRMNRGVALGIAVMIAFAIYLPVDKYKFKQAKPEIEKMIIDYIDELCEVSVADGAISRPDNKYTDEEIENLKQSYLSTINKYWVDSPERFDWFLRLEDIEVVLNNHLNVKKRENYGYIMEIEPIIKNLQIKKTGPFIASAYMECEYVVDSFGSTSFLSMGSMVYVGQELREVQGNVEYHYHHNGQPHFRYEYDENYMYLIYTTEYDEKGNVIYTEKYDTEGKILKRWGTEKPEGQAKAELKEQRNTYSFSCEIPLRLDNGKWRISAINEYSTAGYSMGIY